MTELVVPFPAPPRSVRTALEHLRQAEDAGLEPAGLPLLDRPWDPAGCAPHLRAQLWPWLDDVAGWLNATYAWQTTHSIPACWAAHPHLVAELAVLACLRLVAGEAATPHALEEWHRYALPAFHTRMAERLGIGCPPGRHLDWPARSWAAAYDSAEAAQARRDLFDGDTGRGRSAAGTGPSARHPRAVTP
ncbi:hypothetical protein SAMN05660464_3777 [Geodermatophilus dictyosporus]|uniref:Uncharacterized protein n=1 Tax=Geodermatophilus dictyosporus TaxID=1523247 RepID=A0A1I5RZC1_9ACTN|nr:hypothetical protein [Geodermatophilus dictyosporus]SFP63356.1 hypothetical protein SAMN05660464_3777 [Geodermatophilus dictyosporus]